MKRLTSKEAHKIIFKVFIVTLILLLCYELWWTNYPSPNKKFYKIGLILSKIGYSIVASSIFYFISQYIPIYRPKQEKKIKILYSVKQKTFLIGTLVDNLKFQLNIQGDDFKNSTQFYKQLENINTANPVGAFQNWYLYLVHLKEQLLDIINSITVYNDYLSQEFLQEIGLIEYQLFLPHTFAGHKILTCTDLSYAQIDLQELLVHNKHLQEISKTEFSKYEKQFAENGKLYRHKHYKPTN